MWLLRLADSQASRDMPPSSDSNEFSPPSSKILSRKRTGCLQCRKRRVRCDGKQVSRSNVSRAVDECFMHVEGRPVCKACTKRQAACSYGIRLTWEDDALAANKKHGRAGVWKKQKTNPVGRPGHQSPASPARSESLHGGSDYQDAVCTPFTVTASTPCSEDDATSVDAAYAVNVVHTEDSVGTDEVEGSIAVSEVMRNPGIADVDSDLIAYYASVLCPRAAFVNDGAHNPMQAILLPVALSSRSGRFALMTMAAHHLSRLEDRYKVIELQMRQNTLRSLRSAMASSSCDGNTVLVLALMLCSSDVGLRHSISRYWVLTNV